MNKKQALAILLIIVAIFFSLTSLFFSWTLLKAEKIDSSFGDPQNLEENVTESYGTIQLIIEPQGGRASNEEEYKR